MSEDVRISTPALSESEWELKAKLEQAESELRSYQATFKWMNDQIKDLESHIRENEAAVEPIAEWWRQEDWMSSLPDDAVVLATGLGDAKITLTRGDFRRLAAAMRRTA